VTFVEKGNGIYDISYVLSDVPEMFKIVFSGGTDTGTNKALSSEIVKVVSKDEVKSNAIVEKSNSTVVTPLTTILANIVEEEVANGELTIGNAKSSASGVTNAKTIVSDSLDISLNDVDENFVESENSDIAKKIKQVEVLTEALQSGLGGEIDEKKASQSVASYLKERHDNEGETKTAVVLTASGELEAVVTKAASKFSDDISSDASNNIEVIKTNVAGLATKMNEKIQDVSGSYAEINESVTKLNDTVKTLLANETDIFSDASLNTDTVTTNIENVATENIVIDLSATLIKTGTITGAVGKMINVETGEDVSGVTFVEKGNGVYHISYVLSDVPEMFKIVFSGGTDTATNKALDASSEIVKVVTKDTVKSNTIVDKDNNENVTPLTTIVADILEENVSEGTVDTANSEKLIEVINNAKTVVSTTLDISINDVESNFADSENTEIYKVVKQIEIIENILTAGLGGSVDENKSRKSVVEYLTTQYEENGDDVVINLTDTTELFEIVDTAKEKFGDSISEDASNNMSTVRTNISSIAKEVNETIRDASGTFSDITTELEVIQTGVSDAIAQEDNILLDASLNGTTLAKVGAGTAVIDLSATLIETGAIVGATGKMVNLITGEDVSGVSIVEVGGGVYDISFVLSDVPDLYKIVFTGGTDSATNIAVDASSSISQVLSKKSVTTNTIVSETNDANVTPLTTLMTNIVEDDVAEGTVDTNDSSELTSAIDSAKTVLSDSLDISLNDVDGNYSSNEDTEITKKVNQLNTLASVLETGLGGSMDSDKSNKAIASYLKDRHETEGETKTAVVLTEASELEAVVLTAATKFSDDISEDASNNLSTVARNIATVAKKVNENIQDAIGDVAEVLSRITEVVTSTETILSESTDFVNSTIDADELIGDSGSGPPTGVYPPNMPIISLVGSASINSEKDVSYNDAGATAFDKNNVALNSNIVVTGAVNINVPGSYTLTYTVNDTFGGYASVSRVVTIVDTIIPVITLIGDASLNIDIDTSYNDLGATATDFDSHNLTSSIVVNNPVDITTAGTYYVTYNVTDPAGNTATEVVRTVEVISALTIYGNPDGGILSSQTNVSIVGKPVWGYAALSIGTAIARSSESEVGGPIYENPISPTPSGQSQFVCILHFSATTVKFSYFNIVNNGYVHKYRAYNPNPMSGVNNIGDFVQGIENGTFSLAEIFDYSLPGLYKDNGVWYVLSAITTEPPIWNKKGQTINGTSAEDQFATGVAISGDGTVIAGGAIYNDQNGTSSGQVQIYKFENDSWNVMGSFIYGESSSDHFGITLGLSYDGNIIAMSGHGNNGHVRVYEYNGSSWVQMGQYINAEGSDDRFGVGLGLSSDGTIVAIGAENNDGNGSNSGHVRVYQYNGSSWTKIGQDIDGEASNDKSGWETTINSDGTIVAIGASGNDGNGSNSGHVRVYEYNGSSWVKLGQNINGRAANSSFGAAVSISADGKTVAAGGYNDNLNGTKSGYAAIYEYNGTSWVQMGSNIHGNSGDWAGWAVALDSTATHLAVGFLQHTSGPGYVKTYEYDGSSWTEFGETITTSTNNDRTGTSVSFDSSGNTLIIGSCQTDYNTTDTGSVTVYERNT
jgi:hypothetical protein